MQVLEVTQRTSTWAPTRSSPMAHCGRPSCSAIERFVQSACRTSAGSTPLVPAPVRQTGDELWPHFLQSGLHFPVQIVAGPRIPADQRLDPGGAELRFGGAHGT